MPCLEDLPAPLPLLILKQMPDLTTLDAARRSSSLMNEVFYQHAAEVFEHIASSTLLDEIIFAIRLYVHCLCRPSGSSRDEIDWETMHSLAQAPLPWDLANVAISYVLRKSSYLPSAGSLMLRKKLQHLKTLPHEHLKDKNFRLDLYPGDRATGLHYDIPEPSPPSWLETQFTLRGLWRMSLTRDFDCELKSTIPSPQGSHPDIQPWESDEVEEITATFYRLVDDGSIPPKSDSPLSWEPLAAMPPPASTASASEVAWGETLGTSASRARARPPGYGFFHASGLRLQYSPLREADWAVLRSLGLGIWSLRRMAEELELANYPRQIKPPSQGQVYQIGVDDYLSTNDLLYTWWKLYEAELAFRRREKGKD